MKLNLKIVICFALILLSYKSFSQTDTIPVFKDLQLALKSPQDVIKLDLSKQKISEFPIEIYQFTNLKELYLSKNRLESIPAGINKLTNLEVIDFSKNKLTELPIQLFDCIKLKKIVVNQNTISAIPKEIGKLKDLEYLDMWSNDVGAVPDEIKHCKNLKEIDLRVIEMTKMEQDRIKVIIPKVTVHFSPYCTCSR